VIPAWLMAVLVFGVNFTIWGTVGFLRIVDSAVDRARRLPRNAGSAAHRARRARQAGKPGGDPPSPVLAAASEDIITVRHLAVLMAAHNEEVVIDDSLAAITALVPAENVHVVSDASTDNTVALARRRGVNVMETATNVGKAGALDEGIRVFGLAERFRVVLLLDADTRLDPGYFAAALPLFDDMGVAAVAGCAHSTWQTPGLSFVGRLVTAHRSRIYALTQRLLKFGQTWRRANTTHIVPGFASMYRTTVLPHITINPAGLVIEDFNMTFEVYRKNLGRVGFTLGAKAFTQDPATLHDYVKQTKRWALGLWQTVRRHRLHLDLLSAMVGVLLLELLTASVIFVVLPVVVLILAVPDLLPVVLHWHVALAAHDAVAKHVSLRAIGLGVLAPDLALTLTVAVVERQPRYVLYGWLFVFMRVIDAAIALYTLPRAWQEKSTGRWVSPARRDLARDGIPSPGPALVPRAAPIGETQLLATPDVLSRLGGLSALTLDAPPPRSWTDEGPDDPTVVLSAGLDVPGLAEVRMRWTRAALAGNLDAQYRLGALLATLLDRPELAEARMWWTRAALARHHEAQYQLGVLLATEMDPPDLAEARMWWTEAAEAGHPGAQLSLGTLLADLLDPPEPEEACTWYTLAAAAGQVEAQYHLAVLLAERIDPPYPAEARTWLAQAAAAGHSGARARLETAAIAGVDNAALRADDPAMTMIRAQTAGSSP
jgi:biofilm PGA synthesis N-glycosyltransferase PgaC